MLKKKFVAVQAAEAEKSIQSLLDAGWRLMQMCYCDAYKMLFAYLEKEDIDYQYNTDIVQTARAATSVVSSLPISMHLKTATITEDYIDKRTSDEQTSETSASDN